ncbi:MAG: amidoligase family protein [Ilumatobacteraceae bacterium]
MSDDDRLLTLVARHTSPDSKLESPLTPVAELFGGGVVSAEPGVRYRLDAGGRTIAHALLQTAGRERVCEIVTPVIDTDHARELDRLLAPACALGCTLPVEAAVHVHFDAEPFRDAGVFARTVNLFSEDRERLHERFGTNTACRNIGPPSAGLVELVNSPGFAELPWPEAECRLHGVELFKNRDLNLLNLRSRFPGKDTVEVRILPGGIDTDRIVAQVDDLRTLLLDAVF